MFSRTSVLFRASLSLGLLGVAACAMAPAPRDGAEEPAEEAAAALAFTTTTTIYSDPSGADVRSIAVGTADGETFAVADIADAAGHALFYRRHDGATLHNRVLISNALATLPDAHYLPSVSAVDGSPAVFVSARMCVTPAAPGCAVGGVNELQVTKTTGAVAATRRIDANVANLKPSVIRANPVTLAMHACWTEEAADDDTKCSLRPLAGVWGAPTLVGSGAGTQDHASFAFDASGNRVVVWHDDTNLGTDLELKHDLNASSIQYGGGDKDNWPHLIQQNNVFFAVGERTTGEIGFTKCDAATEDCPGIASNPWVTNKLIIPGVANAKKPEVAADSRGNVLVVHEDGSGPTVKHTFSCDGGATWSAPAAVSTTANATKVAADSLVVAWPIVVYDATNDRYSAVYVEDSGGQIIGKWSRVPATTLCP